jgi:hypothetical protein
VQSSDDGNEVIIVKVVGEEIHIKEEDEPIAISFPLVKDEPEVSPLVSGIAYCYRVLLSPCLST